MNGEKIWKKVTKSTLIIENVEAESGGSVSLPDLSVVVLDHSSALQSLLKCFQQCII